MKKVLTLLTVLLLLSASTTFSQDLCDSYHDIYRVCVEKRDAGSNLDIADCDTYTNQDDCEKARCYWNPQGLPNGACVIDVCIADSDFSGRITGADLTAIKKDLSRVFCLKTPDVQAKAPVEWTGTTLCYNEAGTERSCTGTGEDGEYQKGVHWPIPRFKDNFDGTLTSKVTGLTWLKDANCIATNYSGFDNDEPAGDGVVIWQHALDFVVGINDGTYPLCGAGKTDWRLPNAKELQSLIDFSQNAPALGWFFVTFQVLNLSPTAAYWTSTTFANRRNYAWRMRVFNGTLGFFDKDCSVYGGCGYVWPVRGGQ